MNNIKNQEKILGIFNAFQGQIEAFKFTFTGNCLKLIFTTKKLIISEVKVTLMKRLSWSHEYNCITASESEKSRVNKKNIEDFIDQDNIRNEIQYDQLEKIVHRHKANVYHFTIYEEGGTEVSFDIPLRGNKKRLKEIFKDFFALIIEKA